MIWICGGHVVPVKVSRIRGTRRRVHLLWEVLAKAERTARCLVGKAAGKMFTEFINFENRIVMMHKAGATHTFVTLRELELRKHTCGYNRKTLHWWPSSCWAVGALHGIEYGGVTLVGTSDSLAGLLGPGSSKLSGM